MSSSESSENEFYYDQNERDTYDTIKTGLNNATSLEEIKKLKAQLHATQCFGGRWDWITWQVCDQVGCYITEAYQGNSSPKPDGWVYCDNGICDESEFGGRSTICRSCYETLGNNYKGKYYLCKKCILPGNLDNLELNENKPVRFQHPNLYPRGFNN